MLEKHYKKLQHACLAFCGQKIDVSFTGLVECGRNAAELDLGVRGGKM